MRTKLSVVALSVVAAFALSACGQKEEPKPAATPATPIGKPEVVVKLGHVADHRRDALREVTGVSTVVLNGQGRARALEGLDERTEILSGALSGPRNSPR